MKFLRALPFVAAALLAACSHPAGGNVEDAATNSLDNVIAVEDDADDRAAHLDDAAQEHAQEGQRIGGNAGQALEREASDDLREASDARKSGEQQAGNIEDSAPADDPVEKKP